ncbi:MAG: hypothetical protein IJR90_08670 [Clostridia bacterium]|nr:hypothetical protein [Clostridia bacterium]
MARQVCVIAAAAALMIDCITMREFLKNRKRKPGENEAFFSPYFSLLGIVVSLPAALPLLFTGISGKEIDTSLLVTVIVILACAFLPVAASLNKRIDYDAEGFTRTGIFGRKERYEYDGITSCDESGGCFTLRFGSRSVKAGPAYRGSAEFRKYVKKAYRSTHDGRAIPKKSKADAVYSPKRELKPNYKAYAAVYALLTVCIILFAVSGRPYEKDDLKYMDIKVEKYEIKGDDLYITARGVVQPFVLCDYEKYSYNTTDSMLMTLSRKDQRMRVGYAVYTENGKDKEADIYELSSPDGSVYADLTLTNQIRRNQESRSLGFLAAAAAVCTLHLICALIVSKHRDKLPEWLAELIYRFT